MWDHLNEMSPGFTFQRSCRQCGRRPALPSQLSGGKLSKVWKAERQRERDRERGIREWSLPTLWWWTWPVTYIAAIIWLETQEARQVNICNYRRSWQPDQGTPSELEATPGPLLARTESSPGCVTSAVVSHLVTLQCQCHPWSVILGMQSGDKWLISSRSQTVIAHLTLSLDTVIKSKQWTNCILPDPSMLPESPAEL